MPVHACGSRCAWGRGKGARGCPRAERTSPEGVLSPRARRTSFEGRGRALERGGPRPRGRKGLERGGPRPRERLSLERGGLHSRGIRCVVLAGRGGHQGRGCVVYVLWVHELIRVLRFFAGFRRASPRLIRGLLWLSPTQSVLMHQILTWLPQLMMQPPSTYKKKHLVSRVPRTRTLAMTIVFTMPVLNASIQLKYIFIDFSSGLFLYMLITPQHESLKHGRK
jgi:hypothetical protein